MDLNLLSANVNRLLTNIWAVIAFLKEFAVDPAKDVSISYLNADGSVSVNTFPNIAKMQASQSNQTGSPTQTFKVAPAINADEAVPKGQMQAMGYLTAHQDVSGKLDVADKRVCTAWVAFSVVGGLPTILDSYNIASVALNGLDFDITFLTPMATKNYSMAGIARIDARYHGIVTAISETTTVAKVAGMTGSTTAIYLGAGYKGTAYEYVSLHFFGGK